jgi:tetratricopeptide (TPR) repeat protein
MSFTPVVLLATKLLRDARVVVPHLGLGPPDESDLRRLLRFVGITIHDDRLVPVPSICIPDSDRGAELFIGRVTQVTRTYLILKAVFQFWPTVRDTDAAEVAAMAGVFHEEGRAMGARWQHAAVRGLQHDRRVWSGRSMGDLIDLAEQVMAGTDTRAPAATSGVVGDPVSNPLYAAGVAARQHGRHEDADRCFRATVQFGRETGDHEVACWGLIGLGRTARQRGNMPEAADWFTTAAVQARLCGCAGAEGSALHSLLVLAIQRNDRAEVLRLAMQAVLAYGEAHAALLPALAADVGAFLLLQGQYRGALAIIEAALRSGMPNPHAEMVAQANRAICAAVLGQTEQYAAAHLRAVELADDVPSGDGVATALIDLAEAALHVGRRARAGRLLERGAQLANERGETELQFRATVVGEMVDRASPSPALPSGWRVEPEFVAGLVMALDRKSGA